MHNTSHRKSLLYLSTNYIAHAIGPDIIKIVSRQDPARPDNLGSPTQKHIYLPANGYAIESRRGVVHRWWMHGEKMEEKEESFWDNSIKGQELDAHN